MVKDCSVLRFTSLLPALSGGLSAQIREWDPGHMEGAPFTGVVFGDWFFSWVCIVS